MLTDDIINDIESDLYGFGGWNDLSGLHNAHRAEFLKWFQREAVEISLNEKLSLNIPQEYLYEGNCFDNSHAITINYSLTSYEGFTKTSTSGDYIAHGFNVNNGKVEDYTFQRDNEFWKNNIDKKYYGIEIPIDYINEQRPNKKMGSINELGLLVSYFYKVTQLNI